MQDTSKLKKFAQFARESLIDQVAAKLEHVLATDSTELREKETAVKDLHKQINATSKEAVIERVAYTWFNRFCALRFMDVNRYTKIGIVSPTEGNSQPEILAEAKQGHIDDRFMTADKADHVFKLLSGTQSSQNPQSEAYRLLIVAACNHYHRAMPYLFEKIEDYTELLMPDDLLSNNAILAYVRESMTPDACQDVEIIGWLYQYYISAKKDEVFEDLKKKKKKIGAENIPAATQLFTPHWIVRYLVENSLGRLWLLNNPSSNLKAKMEYYIEPDEQEDDFLKISSPEELKICDPACGSGHMLTYAFDLLYAIYEEEGYDASEIPSLILQNNLYGIELDERAGSLAAFALSMKARDKNRRFLEKNIQPNICVLENISFSGEDFDAYKKKLGHNLFTGNLLQTLGQFEEADNFGSLIQPAETDVGSALELLKEQNFDEDLFLKPIHDKVLKALTYADYLSPKYHVVVANPPYMGGKSMNGCLAVFIKENYKDSKSDLFSAFIERNLDLTQKQGVIGMITMQGWMFLSSYEKLRSKILNQKTIFSMAHLGARGFDSIGGEVVSTTAFTIGNNHNENYKGQYLRLIDGKSEAEKADDFKKNLSKNNELYFTASATDFKKISGSPISYWISQKLRNLFSSDITLSNIGRPRQGLASTNNELFYRQWHEINNSKIGFSVETKEQAIKSGWKWLPLNKGGSFRRWFGNNEWIINFENDGKTICDYIDNTPGASVGSNGRVINREFYYQPGVTYSDLTTGGFGARSFGNGYIFDTSGPSIFDEHNYGIKKLITYINTHLFQSILDTVCTGLHYSNGVLAGLPVHYPDQNDLELKDNTNQLIDYSCADWNAYETSWDFEDLPLLAEEYKANRLAKTYQNLRTHWQEITDEMKRLEEENNRIFIEAYGLQDELTPDVPLEEITLTCNPRYRYKGDKTDEQLETSLLSETMQEFIHYAVGCMFGRYSLDKEGLVLANQGEGVDDYLSQVPDPSFKPDSDNVIPVLDGNWFEDDIVERFQKFLRVTFGDENYKENLEFIENAIGKNLRKYFTKDFYPYHVKRYKKRPIYWMFSSPKGTFNAMIYMHRYRPDTASIVLNDYLRNFRTKLEAKKDNCEQTQISGSEAEKVKATKEIDKLKTMIEELNQWEHEVLYPLAVKRTEIDLDDGVKVNYPKFGTALKKIAGLS